MYSDLSHLVTTHQGSLLAEAENDRLVAQLPQTHAGVRRGLAHACLRLATWLDDATDRTGYVRASDSGPADWATRTLSV